MWARDIQLFLVFLACGAASVAHAQAGSVVEARGEASYRISIVVPPGPAGHQPDLALVYNSGEGKGPAGWLGFGWSVVGESRIERETRTGSPYDFDNRTCGTGSKFPCYRSAYVLDGQDLICSSGTCSTCSSAAPCRYRTQSDDGRIVNFKGDTSGWEIKDRDGRTLVYGAASAGTGRLLNPASIIGQIFSWQIESSTDVNGNVIVYTYDTVSSANVAYLKKLQYGQGTTANRSIEFILNNPTSAPRSDRPVSAKAGFRQQMDRRVTSIEVRADSNALVTRYDLTYSQDPDSLRSQLATVQRKGSDGVAALPPYAFDYSYRAVTRGLFASTEISFEASATSCNAGGGFYASTGPSGVIVSIADMNRDGLADLYQVANYNSYPAGPVAVALGTGTRFRPGPGQNCSGSNNSVLGLGTPWSAYGLLFAEDLAGSAVMDLDGDGYLDHLFDNGFPYETVSHYLRRGSADGFIEPPLNTSFELDPQHSGLPYLRISQKDSLANVDVISAMADVTGDGRPDLVGTQRAASNYDDGTGYDITWGGSWTGWAVFVNRGLKSGAGEGYLDFGTEPIRWPAPLSAPIQHDNLGLISTVILADQNGDGLADRVFKDLVEYGYGAGFYAQESVPGELGVDLAATASCLANGTFDLNGDGFLDHIQAQGASSANPNWTVHFGTGHGFSTQAKIFPADGGGITPGCIDSNGLNATPSSLRDVNGDGVLDRLRGGFGVILNAGALDPNASADPNLPSAALPGLMLRATDPLGGVVEFTYQGAPQIKDASGLPANPGFSLPRPVVTRVRYRDGRTGTPVVTNKLWYGNGTFDYAEKEFRGFGTVIATEVENGLDATQTTSTYLTDRICAFGPASVLTALGATIFARESITYQTVTGGGAVPAQWTKCLASTSVVESVEGSEAAKKVRRTSWDYGSPISANYNVMKSQEWGEWNLAANQDVPGDERITEFTYAIAVSGWPSIVSRVSFETVKDNAGNIYSKRRYCYVSTCTVASKGLLLAVRDYLTDYSADPPVIDVQKAIATIVYDAFGNPTKSTGAVTSDDTNGLQTTIAYDSTYQTFPTSVSRGSDVGLPLRPLVTALAYTGCAGGFSPPPALGLPCSVTSPQGQADVLGYDPFGRVKRVERPTRAYLETRSYTLPGSASPGQNTLEIRIIRSGFSDLVEKQYLDGLSRVYKSESPGKQAQTAIVDRTFDSRGRLRSESLPYFTGVGLLRTNSYDPLGRPTIALDPDSFTQRVQRYSPWTVIDETYFGAATSGNRKERTERSSDGLGRLVRVAQFEDAVAATTPYVVTAKYDSADRLYEVHDPIANNGTLCASLNMGPYCAMQDHVTEITWDTLGRRVKIDDPDSGIWAYKYDDAGLVKERTQNPGTSSARTQLFTYDPLERPTAKTFTPTGSGVANASFIYENNNANPDYAQLIQVSATGGTTYLYGYDAAGRRNAVIQRTAGKEFGSVLEYDELDRVTHRVFPDGDAFDYAYDGTRLLSILADAANPAFKGTVLKYADYDALGRAKVIEVGQGAGSAALLTNTYTYDSTNARLTRVTGRPGNLVPNDPDGDRIAAPSDKCPYAYDPDQLDGGGVGETSAADGINNACQCGDVDGSGRVTFDDAVAILDVNQGYGKVPLAKPERCDVNGDTVCDPNDFYVVWAALESEPVNLQHCPALSSGNVPSSAPLDLSVNFDGLNRLTSQLGQLGTEPVSRSYSYDGLSRLKTAVGPWEKGRGRGNPDPVTWSYRYDALGNLRKQESSRPVNVNGSHRTWNYYHATKPRFLSQFADLSVPWERISATAGGEAASVDLGTGLGPDSLTWNAQGKLHRFTSSTYSYDVFDETTLVVTGPSGSSTSIVSVGDDFAYDIGAQRANKFFSIDGVRIASLATSHVAPNAANPPALRIAIRFAEPLAALAAALLLALGLLGLAGVTVGRRTPVWLSVPGIGVLSYVLVALPSAAFAATLTFGTGRFGRHAEPILAYLTDHLGTIRGAVNQDGIVVETRDYAPFGESIAHTGAFSLQHRFTGQPQDDQAGGLYNYGARFYNPKWGRFISPDDAVQGFDSQGLNPFAYVLNRPTSATDPTGQFIWNGISYGAWSTSTLQSGVLQTAPSGSGYSAGTATTRTASGIAGGFRMVAMLNPGILGFMTESTPRPPPSVVAMLAKMVFTDLQALAIGAYAQIVVNPFQSLGSLINGLVNGDVNRIMAALSRLIVGTLVPRYGLQNGPYWGRGRTSNDRLDSVLEDAGYAHDDLCKPACTSDADRVWIQTAWKDQWRLGPYGQAYRILGTAAFSARIGWRTLTSRP